MVLSRGFFGNSRVQLFPGPQPRFHTAPAPYASGPGQGGSGGARLLDAIEPEQRPGARDVAPDLLAQRVERLELVLVADVADELHGHVLPAADVRTIAADLLTMSRAQRAAIRVMHPGRVDVIAAGALVLQRILERTGLPQVVVSEHDILDGIAWSLVE